MLILAQNINNDIMAGDTINRLKVVLAEKRKTNKWLAEQLNKTEMTVSRWAQNRSQPSLEQLVEIAKVLDIEVKDLINETKNIVAQVGGPKNE